MRKVNFKWNLFNGKGVKRIALPLALVALIVCASIGGTLAYMMDQTSAVTNEFTPVQVSCVVDGNLDVTNTSDIPVYLRAMVVANWKNDSGEIFGEAPVCAIDLNDKWTLGDDGFYYYDDVVPVRSSVDGTVNGPVKQITYTTTKPEGAEGYHFTVELVAEVIQADGMGVDSAQDAWEKACKGS